MKRSNKSLGGSLAKVPAHVVRLPFSPWELSEEELIQVAGGAGTCTPHPTKQPTMREVIDMFGQSTVTSDTGSDTGC
jgi:hypothetical protein